MQMSNGLISMELLVRYFVDEAIMRMVSTGSVMTNIEQGHLDENIMINNRDILMNTPTSFMPSEQYRQLLIKALRTIAVSIKFNENSAVIHTIIRSEIKKYELLLGSDSFAYILRELIDKSFLINLDSLLIDPAQHGMIITFASFKKDEKNQLIALYIDFVNSWGEKLLLINGYEKVKFSNKKRGWSIYTKSAISISLLVLAVCITAKITQHYSGGAKDIKDDMRWYTRWSYKANNKLVMLADKLDSWYGSAKGFLGFGKKEEKRIETIGTPIHLSSIFQVKKPQKKSSCSPEEERWARR
jgi:hypothetical protein